MLRRRPKARRRTHAPVLPLRRDLDAADEIVGTEADPRLIAHPEARLTGGDVDADWRDAAASGDEAVGGSVPTPDQDVVDEIGRALGVEQGLDAEVTACSEILSDRDRHRWDEEWDEAQSAEGG